MAEFNIEAYLTTKRKEGLEHAKELLWENLEGGFWWGYFSSDDSREIDRRKISLQHDHYHPVLVELLTGLSTTITYLKKGKSHNILQYGAARRINSIYKATNSVCAVAPHNRKSPLSNDEARGLSDDLLLIYVHMIGVFDALSIAFNRTTSPPIELSETKADILKKTFRDKLGNSTIDAIFLDNKSWLKRIKEELRNRYVHRVPPYVPTSSFTDEEAARYAELEEEKFREIRNQNFDRIDEIAMEQSKLGTFRPWICFSDSDGIILLHPTVLDDVMRFQVVILSIFEELLPALEFNWPSPSAE